MEKEVNLVEALACKDFLETHGVEVLMSRTTDENDPITDEINECNAFEPDLAIDIHSNSGRGDGFEAFYHYKGGLSKDLAENIETEVYKNWPKFKRLQDKIRTPAEKIITHLSAKQNARW